MTSLRIGIGYDVHALSDGRPLVLGGVTVPHPRGLAGHSDADALLHAVTDALLGALALGDIGQWFPPGDSRFAGADSAELLAQVVARVHGDGWRLGNLDCTLIAERPKLSPHLAAMRANLARVLDAEVERISVKATTTDRLGLTGREEGIAAQAVVLLESAGAV